MKEKVQSRKGITLVSLVVTIIILIILAGTSLNLVIGKDGIITVAKRAKENIELAKIEEETKLNELYTQLGSDGNTGGLDYDAIAKLDEFKTVIAEAITNKGVETSPNDSAQTMAENIGKIPSGGSSSGGETENPGDFNVDELVIESPLNTDKYGWKVSNYLTKTDATGRWRLFYQDKNCTYIISDNYVGPYNAGDYYEKYPNGASVSKVGQRLSSMISTLFIETNTTNRIRQMAWLTDTSDEGMWAEYKNEDAIFAIGSPTLELWTASRNTKYSSQVELSMGTKGYSYNYSRYAGSMVGTSTAHGIYMRDTTNSYFIASPSGRASSDHLYYLNGLSSSFYDNSDNSFARPVVCIPTSVFNSKYESSLVDE